MARTSTPRPLAKHVLWLVALICLLILSLYKFLTTLDAERPGHGFELELDKGIALGSEHHCRSRRVPLEHRRDAGLADCAGEALKTAEYAGGGTVEEKLTDNIATIGENQSLRRAALLEVSEGVVVSYVHNAAAANMGKIGVLVALEGSASSDTLNALGRTIQSRGASGATRNGTFTQVGTCSTPRVA